MRYICSARTSNCTCLSLVVYRRNVQRTENKRMIQQRKKQSPAQRLKPVRITNLWWLSFELSLLSKALDEVQNSM
jgi:hypothetical protein